ncbi:MAG: hypothetical protein R2747_08180 [Pyrinomonadaceae bacterium]
MKLKTRSVCRLMIGLIGVVLLGTTVYGQGSTRVLMCNEKDSVRDTISYPRQSEIIDGQKYAVWRAFIDDEKGLYQLTVSSYSDFEIFILRKSREADSDWKEVSSTSFPKIKTNSSGGKVFSHSYNFFRSGLSDKGGFDFYIEALPKTPTATLTATWYTTNCGKSTGSGGSGSSGGGSGRGGAKPASACGWEPDPGIFGQPSSYTCKCNGKVSHPSKCSGKP